MARTGVSCFEGVSHLIELIMCYSRWVQQKSMISIRDVSQYLNIYSVSFGLLKEGRFEPSDCPAESRIPCYCAIVTFIFVLSFHALNIFLVYFRFRIRAARTQPLTQKFSRRRTPTRSCRAGQPRPKCNARASPQITAFLIAVSPDQVSLWVAGRGKKWEVTETPWTASSRV